MALNMSEIAIQPFHEPDRRRAERAALRLNATMREAGRGRVTARVIDISTHGCRIEAGSGASVETWLWLSIAGLETQYCRVVWRCQEFAGLEFATPDKEKGTTGASPSRPSPYLKALCRGGGLSAEDRAEPAFGLDALRKRAARKVVLQRPG